MIPLLTLKDFCILSAYYRSNAYGESADLSTFKNSSAIRKRKDKKMAHDTSQQLHLTFSSLREAISFAKEKGLIYTVCNPTQISSPPKSYGINFTCSRIRGC